MNGLQLLAGLTGLMAIFCGICLLSSGVIVHRSVDRKVKSQRLPACLRLIMLTLSS